MKLIKDNKVTDPTPELVAELFAGMDSADQAKFFNHVAEISSTWKLAGWVIQLQYITDEDGLSLAGRRVMQQIGEYSHWGLIDGH